MQLRTRVTLGSLFAASAVLSTALAWHAQQQLAARPRPATATVAGAFTEPPPAAATVDPQQPRAAALDPQPHAAAEQDPEQGEGDPPDPDAPTTTLDSLDLAWLPNGYVRGVGPDKTAALAQLVEAWAANDSDEPRIEYRKGVVFARSTEDRGDDGPYPRSAQPQDQRVCGEASTWLRESLRRRLANETLTCDRNVCSYGGMEYAPDGFLVFREITVDGEPQWALDAWIEVYRAALDPDSAARNRAEVVRALRHQLRTSCAGEPPGAY